MADAADRIERILTAALGVFKTPTQISAEIPDTTCTPAVVASDCEALAGHGFMEKRPGTPEPEFKTSGPKGHDRITQIRQAQKWPA